MKKRIDLLIIDPQNDFCTEKSQIDGNEVKGSLFVHRVDKDMDRLSEFINNQGHLLTNIHVTLDSHHVFDIAHPIFWISKDRKHPQPLP